MKYFYKHISSVFSSASRPLHLVHFLRLVLFGTILLTACISQQQQTVRQYAAGNTNIFTPTVIPLSAPEIGNPWRGAYYELNPYDSSVIPGWPPDTHSYVEYCWKDIEPTEGHYNFSNIDKQLMLVQAKYSGTLGLRIKPTDPTNEPDCIPDYLKALMPHGGSFTNTADGGSRQAYEPDWNDPHYLARAQALITALGKRYDGDPRLGWFEIEPYGSWGEWNLSGWPSGSPVATVATKKQIIDMNVKAFPHTRLLINTDANVVLDYAMSRSHTIGLRSDCLGKSDLGGAIHILSRNPQAVNRWKTQPLVMEFCALHSGSLQQAAEQIKTYHVAMVADQIYGDFSSWSDLSATDLNYLTQIYKTSGYRFILDSLTAPSQIGAGGRFSVVTKWSNVNVTPAYNPWNVMIQLRNSSNTVVWQGKSSLDLQTLLPTNSSGTDTPLTVVDNFTLPSSVPSGRYTIAVTIDDPADYYSPLQLAIQGREPDGSYSVGVVTVNGKPTQHQQ